MKYIYIYIRVCVVNSILLTLFLPNIYFNCEYSNTYHVCVLNFVVVVLKNDNDVRCPPVWYLTPYSIINIAIPVLIIGFSKRCFLKTKRTKPPVVILY